MKGPGARWLILVLVVSSLTGMLIHYDTVRVDQFPYTPTKDLQTDYDAHVGEMTYFWARVTEVEQDRFRVDNFAVDLWVTGPTDGLSPGDTVQVYGTIEAEHRIESRRVIVSPRINRFIMFAISALAAGLVGLYTLRYWRFDTETLSLREREP